ncbi:hypothetical protein CY34DRAFT_809111 [Suillus luteus UH-Slu-Lm8-n1]|uniref:Uncharacterized protein n=1 Tax=Suillus luteus UH-Slu-Lm8-n1 TaxID=930992 RepID=A0A0D0B479_9AGAM|nr:hypothetical protein CY34DRAFT_809111 [Suillus luteus UH-Slu-Lm8-n1]
MIIDQASGFSVTTCDRHRLFDSDARRTSAFVNLTSQCSCAPRYIHITTVTIKRVPLAKR